MWHLMNRNSHITNVKYAVSHKMCDSEWVSDICLYQICIDQICQWVKYVQQNKWVLLISTCSYVWQRVSAWHMYVSNMSVREIRATTLSLTHCHTLLLCHKTCVLSPRSHAIRESRHSSWVLVNSHVWHIMIYLHVWRDSPRLTNCVVTHELCRDSRILWFLSDFVVAHELYRDSRTVSWLTNSVISLWLGRGSRTVLWLTNCVVTREQLDFSATVSWLQESWHTWRIASHM